MGEQEHKCSVSAAFGTPEPEHFVEKFKTLVERVGEAEKEEILRIVTDAYLMAVEDCREHWHQYAGPVGMWGLKKLYDTVEPDHNLVFH